MFKHPEDIQEIIDSIKLAAQSQQVVAYLHGQYAGYLITENESYREPVLRFILSPSSGFDVYKFYKSLTRSVTINHEVENSPSRYHIVSKPYELVFDIIPGFNPKDPIQAGNISPFSIDSIYVDIHKEDAIDSTGVSIPDIKHQPPVIRAVNDSITPAMVAIRCGVPYSVEVDFDTLKKMTQASVPINNTQEAIDILLCPRPGTALGMLCDYFSNDKQQLFAHISDIALNNNIPMSENVSVDTVLSSSKFEIVDVYNAFLLETQQFEDEEKRKIRFETTLKLLLDSPDLETKKSYIDDYSVFKTRSEVFEQGKQTSNTQNKSRLGIDATPLVSIQTWDYDGDYYNDHVELQPIEASEAHFGFVDLWIESKQEEVHLDISTMSGDGDWLVCEIDDGMPIEEKMHNIITKTPSISIQSVVNKEHLYSDDYRGKRFLIVFNYNNEYATEHLGGPLFPDIYTGQLKITAKRNDAENGIEQEYTKILELQVAVTDKDSSEELTVMPFVSLGIPGTGGGTVGGGGIDPDDPCLYGDCPDCVPSECPGLDDCCCCHVSNYVEDIQSRCYDKVFISCNEDGTGPDVGETFDEGCTLCETACQDFVLVPGMCSELNAQDWWKIPLGSSCDCEDQVDSESSAFLRTCVTCGIKCEADIAVSVSNCEYGLTLTPGAGCCGLDAFIDFIFVIDTSGSMGDKIAQVQTGVNALVDEVSGTGATLRAGLVQFGHADGGIPILTIPLTEDIDSFKNAVSNIVADGSFEPDIDAVRFAAESGGFGTAVSSFILLIADEQSQAATGSTSPSQAEVDNAVAACQAKNIVVYVQDAESPQRLEIATKTGGERFDFGIAIEDLADQLALTTFPSSCNCIDSTPIELAGIRINKCSQEMHDLNQCVSGFCDIEETYFVCGDIIDFQPQFTSFICCSEIGCECGDGDGGGGGPNVTDCCGANCPGSEVCVNNTKKYGSLEEAIESVWCNCMDNAFSRTCSKCCCPDGATQQTRRCSDLDPLVETPVPGENCCDCPEAEDCCDCWAQVSDSNGDLQWYSRLAIAEDVKEIWESCSQAPLLPPGWVPDPDIINAESEESIGTTTGCFPVRNPDALVLNNGIGLIAYESLTNPSVIQVKQFKTVLKNKAFSNRTTNYGRLENSVRWNGNIAKLYYYEDFPIHILDEDDKIAFVNGPLSTQIFSISEIATGTDDIGPYIQFDTTGYTLLEVFDGSDDAYNIKWRLLDDDDTGLIGDATDTTTDASTFIIENSEQVNGFLELPQHIYNGEAVPVANPSIAAAHNFQNIENAHHVYVAYQAYEDSKWNVYLRQLRLSEYSLQNVDANTEDMSSYSSVIYRIVCVHDSQGSLNNSNLATRTIVMEILLMNGQDVLYTEGGFNQFWGSLCPGSPVGDFPQKKVYAVLSHNATTDQEIDQFGFNAIFCNWKVGQEFVVPKNPPSERDLFDLLVTDDHGIPIGDFEVPQTVYNINISSSSVDTEWYPGTNTNLWEVSSGAAWAALRQYRGIDMSEPVLVSHSQDAQTSDGTPVVVGHCLRPRVKVNNNNDVFVVYETTSDVTLLNQIYIVGTATPSSSLPYGVLVPKNLDESFNYFVQPDDFVYRKKITSNGINEEADLAIDPNDVVHIAWQSNRDNYWEIYYTNSEDDFVGQTRITDYQSRSLRPRIITGQDGKTYIVWHDDRFTGWEIMMAYREDVRTPNLSEQNSYMAGHRNSYAHYLDEVPLTLTNNSLTRKCYQDFVVSFYTNRLLEGSAAFVVRESEWPFAFRTLLDEYSSQICLNPSQPTSDFSTITNMQINPVSWANTGSNLSAASNFFIVSDNNNNKKGLQNGAVSIYYGDSSANYTQLIETIYNPENLAGYGNSLGLSRNHILVGSSMGGSQVAGAVYVYDENLDQQLILTAPTRDMSENDDPKQFGHRISANDTIAAISSIDDDVKSGVTSGGSVFVYNMNEDDIGFGEIEKTIISPLPEVSAQFGSELSNIFRNYILVSEAISSTTNVYLVDLDSGYPIYTFSHPTGTAGDNFGGGLLLGENRVVISASGDSTDDGAVYIYNYDGTLVKKISGQNNSGEKLGSSIALTRDGKLLIGSPQHNGTHSNQGVVKVYDMQSGEKTAVIQSPDPMEDQLFGQSITSSRDSDYWIIGTDKDVAYVYRPQLYLDLTPQIRVDQMGNNRVDTPLPVEARKNQAYFIKVSATDQMGNNVTMPDQMRTVSCITCSSDMESWNYETCSVKFDLTNSDDSAVFVHIKVNFYADRDKVSLVQSIGTFPDDSDLNAFSIDDENAEDVWADRGLRLEPDETKNVILWPSLSSKTGLLCSVPYYVEVLTCKSELSPDVLGPCTEEDLLVTSFNQWYCNCESPRWGDEAPVNINKTERWKSSGNGFSDVRITETDNEAKNLNPVIRVKENGVGVIVYQSNRGDLKTFNLYASVFGIIPAYNMYATGAEAIHSFGETLARIDYPIKVIGTTGIGLENYVEGLNPTFDLDLVDDIFLAAEQMFDQSKPTMWEKDKQQTIVVRKGVSDLMTLFEAETQTFIEQVEEDLSSSAILNTQLPDSTDAIFESIMKQARVKNDFVKYHVTRNGTTMAVVDQCDIEIEAIGTPDCVAYRVRGEFGDWTEWIPLDPDFGENRVEFKWNLSSGNGVKNIYIQFATYMGLTSNVPIRIVADYTTVQYVTRLYRSTEDTTDNPGTGDENYLENNILNTLDGIPVASMRVKEIEDGSVISREFDYIFVEIVPSAKYMSKFSEEDKTSNSVSPSFDFIQQGSGDFYGLSTSYHKRSDGVEVFRGVVTIQKEDSSANRDGLALIVPHFISDCSGGSGKLSSFSSNFVRDRYNQLSSGQPNTISSVEEDFWKDDRERYGQIQYPVTIRPTNEDPYFAFGDPNYRLKNEQS